MDNKKYTNLLIKLEKRFEGYQQHFEHLTWDIIESKLIQNIEKMDALLWMENTGGEPSVLEFDQQTNTILFCDFSAESPVDRRSLCYDQKALDLRKRNKPTGNVISICDENNVKLLSELQYRNLQTLNAFDQKSSSWIQTPSSIRELGGALFMDRRYNTVFVYHNSAESYYSSRGFRVSLVV